MSGDIDIVEHDLMENPRVRTIFPDLKALKKEIVDADHEELRKQSSSNTNNTPDENVKCIKEELATKDELTNSLESDAVKKLKKSLLHSNVIVFGNICSKTYENKLKKHVKINIKDIRHYLKESQSYCQICKTLFPKINMFEEHKLLTHQDTYNEKIKTLNHEKRDSMEGRKNSIKNDQINLSDENEKNKQCFHCKEVFSTQELLIEHIYEVLDKKAKVRNISSDKHCKVNSDSNKNSQAAEEKAVDNSKDNAKYGIKVDENGLAKTTLVNKLISENEPYSGSQNQTEVVCDASRNEALQCTICLCYFQHLRFYEMHMERKHKTKVRQFKVVKFNPKCIFCSNIYPTFKKYNLHLRRAHSSLTSNTNIKEIISNQNRETRTDNSYKSKALEETTTISVESSNDLINDRPLIFKRVLFKCLKCEIHFLSPKLATSHTVHSEILINWKCLLCKMFLKKSDEDLHLKQHTYTDSFIVLNVEDKDSNRIMIKCSKCPLHVPESEFRQHVNVCGESVNTWHCLICNIEIEGNLKTKRAHNVVHSDINGMKSDFILINDSLMSPQIQTEKIDKSQQVKDIRNNRKRKLREISDSPPINEQFIGFKSDTADVDTGSSEELRSKMKKLFSANDDYYSKFFFQPPHKPKFLLNLTYCKNCECFIQFNFGLDVHVKNRCHSLAKRVCNFCGIVLTLKTIQRHKAFHELNPYLKLQDFRFYDIETCKQILPPRPIYPKCDRCEAHFVSKVEIRCHICGETPILCCDMCEMKFASERALNLHIPFHCYYLQSKSALDPRPNNLCELHVSKKKRNKNAEIKKLPLEDRSENKICENMMDVDEPQIIENDEAHADLADTNNKKQISSLQENYTNDKRENIEDVHYLYTCEICNVSVGHYDQLIEHCHSHYNNSYRNLVTKKCSDCDIMFNNCSMISHREMHESGIRSESFVILTCDLFYFGRSNAEWLNHVFKSVPESKRENILKLAIYKDEHRIKLNVAQQGHPEFTLYKCAKCCVYIDHVDIFNHREKCKGTNMKYPCHFCSVVFLSAAQQARHLELHERCTLSDNSYRIVVFNQIKDKPLNDLLLNKTDQYVLYKCRNCHGVVTWSLMRSHHCNLNDLKKCTSCGLLIYSTDYDKHNTRHRTIDTFVASNMRVVMFGQERRESKVNNENHEVVCSFSGIVSDYIFYKCVKCNVCIRSLRLSSKHFCLIAAAKFKCVKCHLYFDEGKKKGHYALHSSDVEFTADAICVIPFDPQETYKCLDFELNGVCSYDDLHRESVESVATVSIEEKTDTLYRCSCGLHYLTEENAREHVQRNKCGAPSKKKLQTCSKCNLNFTPEILYKHLLQHHAEKYIRYSFDIINISEQPFWNEDSVGINSAESTIRESDAQTECGHTVFGEL